MSPFVQLLWGARRGYGTFGAVQRPPTERPTSQPFDPSKSLTAIEQDSTIIAVIEMSQSSWLVAAVVAGVERQPIKRLGAEEAALLKLLHHWRRGAPTTSMERRPKLACFGEASPWLPAFIGFCSYSGSFW